MSNTAPAKQVRKPKKLPFVIMCILSAIVAVLNVLLCVLVPKYYTTINSFLYKGPDADEVAAFRQASADMTQKVESEGIVMLENKNQTLPLASGSKINLFGYGSRDIVYGGSGSGSGDSSNNITLEQGLTNAGFSVNPELVSFYNDHFVERVGVGFTGNNFDINEPAVNEYSDEMIANAKAYSDVAVFVVSRLGGEGADLPMDMDPNATTHIVSSGKDIEQVVKGGDAGKHYLELQSVEQQVLDMLKENFGTVVVLVNSTNAMELGFLEDEGVDAALWIGCLGSTGANAVGEVLSGAVNPSGRTTDTFAYAVESAPSYYSIGAYNYTNCEWVNTNPIGAGAAPDFYHYVDYIEGIYVGYRYYETAAEDGFIEDIAVVNHDLKIEDMKGLAYDDPKWNDFLEQIPVSEMVNLVSNGGWATQEVPSVGKLGYTEVDGPNGVNNIMAGSTGNQFCAQSVLACSWNTELAYDMGETFAQEAVAMKIAALYAPAMNIHRSPFSGRNYEYYSEDGLHSGKMAAAETQGIQSQGVTTYCKHFAVNDQESNRDSGGLLTWVNEQAMREIYIKPFEIAVKEGGTRGIMSSFNRIGEICAAENADLLTTVLRNEWGFRGAVITDCILQLSYINIDRAIAAGNDLILSLMNMQTPSEAVTNSPAGHQVLRTATHNILYASANSIGQEVSVIPVPYWLYITVAVVDAGLIALCVFYFVRRRKNVKRWKEQNSVQA